MSAKLMGKDKSLRDYFIIAYLIPISATVLVTLRDGMQSSLVTTQISPLAMIVVMTMVHAPTIAAMIVVFRDDRFEGIKALFRQLKSWRFKPIWYLRSLLIFPASILASLFLMTLFSQRFAPIFSSGIFAIGTLISALLEEIGWTGFATPRMLKRNSPLKVAILLGVIHTFWHLAADFWGAANFYGYLYIAHFLLWMVGLIVLRIITLWIFVRTQSLVLGWLTHYSYTGGQTIFVSLELSGLETIQWNIAFVVVMVLIIVGLFALNKDFRDFWRSGLNPG